MSSVPGIGQLESARRSPPVPRASVRPRGYTVRSARCLSLAAALVGLFLGGSAFANHVVMHGGPFGGVVVSLLPDPAEPDLLYVAAFGSGVYRSRDDGLRWVRVSRGLDPPTVLTLAMEPVLPRVLYAGTDSGIFVSRDSGETWSRAGRQAGDRNVRSLAVPATRPTVLYAATDRGLLWSWNEGRSWASRSAGITVGDLRVIRSDPTSGDRLFAAGFGGVLTSDDGGRQWRRADRGLDDLRVRALAFDPRRPAVLYAGTAGRGVFITANGGRTWRPFNEGLRNVTVLALTVTPDGTRFAGTVGGVHRRGPDDSAWALVGEGVLSLTITFVVANPHRPRTVYAGTGGLVFVSDDHGRHWRELAVSVTGAPGPEPGSTATAAHSHSERR